MEDLFLKTKKEYKNFISYLGNVHSIGSDGVGYKYKGYFLKSLEGPNYYNNHSEIDIDKLRRFSNIDTDTYIFAKNFVFVGNEIYALIMKYINYPKISSINLSKFSFKSLEKASLTLQKETQLISKLGIEVVDPFDVNILFGDDKFYLVDTMDYLFSDIESLKLFKENLSLIMKNIYSVLFDQNIVNFISNIPELKDYLKDDELLSNPIYFLTKLKKYLSEYCEKNVSSLNSASKKISKKKMLVI